MQRLPISARAVNAARVGCKTRILRHATDHVRSTTSLRGSSHAQSVWAERVLRLVRRELSLDTWQILRLSSYPLDLITSTVR